MFSRKERESLEFGLPSCFHNGVVPLRGPNTSSGMAMLYFSWGGEGETMRTQSSKHSALLPLQDVAFIRKSQTSFLATAEVCVCGGEEPFPGLWATCIPPITQLWFQHPRLTCWILTTGFWAIFKAQDEICVYLGDSYLTFHSGARMGKPGIPLFFPHNLMR